MKKLAIILMLGSSFSICALSPFEPLTSWEKKSVKVCFGTELDKPHTVLVNERLDVLKYSEDQKEWIKQIITTEFTKERTGIEFTGWENCSQSPEETDVVLFRIEPETSENEGRVFTERGGQATIGQRGIVTQSYREDSHRVVEFVRGRHHYLNVVVLNTKSMDKVMDSQNYIKMIALHEFGHTAGLRHQQIHYSEMKKDPNCIKLPHLVINPEPIYSSTVAEGPYDHNSIMNYCWINLLASRTGLSFRGKGTEDKVKLTDPTLYSVKIVSSKRQDYKLRVGLSMEDLESLRCMYLYDTSPPQKKCLKSVVKELK